MQSDAKILERGELLERALAGRARNAEAKKEKEVMITLSEVSLILKAFGTLRKQKSRFAELWDKAMKTVEGKDKRIQFVEDKIGECGSDLILTEMDRDNAVELLNEWFRSARFWVADCDEYTDYLDRVVEFLEDHN